MNKYVVSATRIPTAYNSPTSYVVEAESERDAFQIVRHSLRDLAEIRNYAYDVQDYTPPPAGRILSSYAKNPRHKRRAHSADVGALEARAIARGKREILEDIKSGRVPSTARTFAELHDYVDANMYAGLADASSPLTGLSRHDERASMRRVQDALDAWLRMGRRAGGKHKVVSARRNPATLDQRRAELMAVCKRRGIPADASTPLNVLLERIMADDAARAERLRRNPLSEDGAVVSNPRRKGAAKRAGKRTAAQNNAAKAMKLYHSGQASSLAEAWSMLRRR